LIVGILAFTLQRSRGSLNDRLRKFFFGGPLPAGPPRAKKLAQSENRACRSNH
jgi:hypothetical protein